MALEVLVRGGPFPVNDKPPKYPLGMLSTHVLFKGAQAGSVLGVVLSTPYYMRPNVRGERSFLRCVGRASAFSVLGCGAAAGALLMYKYNSFEDKQDMVTDRAYRLKFNESQNQADRWAISGGLVGLLAARTVLPNLGALGGVAIGLAAGLGVLKLSLLAVPADLETTADEWVRGGRSGEDASGLPAASPASPAVADPKAAGGNA